MSAMTKDVKNKE